MAKTTVGVKLDDETRNRLKKLGDAKRRSTHWLVKDAVARYLDAEERYEREKGEDLARWKRYVETGYAIPHEEVKARMRQLIDAAAKKAAAK